MTHHNGETHTGTRDEHYNLVSVLYHCLETASTCDTYIQDAQQSGDNDLAQFFREVQEQNRSCAERAKQLMSQRINQLVAR
jgi:hypothetical protein